MSHEKPLKIPVFDHLYDLDDNELQFYVDTWEHEERKVNALLMEARQKLDALREEQSKRK